MKTFLLFQSWVCNAWWLVMLLLVVVHIRWHAKFSLAQTKPYHPYSHKTKYMFSSSQPSTAMVAPLWLGIPWPRGLGLNPNNRPTHSVYRVHSRLNLHLEYTMHILMYTLTHINFDENRSSKQNYFIILHKLKTWSSVNNVVNWRR
jgi:hypothetical protein